MSSISEVPLRRSACPWLGSLPTLQVFWHFQLRHALSTLYTGDVELLLRITTKI